MSEYLSNLGLLDQTIGSFEAFSPDLKSGGLAGIYVKSLFEKIGVGVNEHTLAIEGAKVFYNLAKDILGPVAVAFTDTALKLASSEKVVFPARDATPFYVIANCLVKVNPVYGYDCSQLSNPYFNRKLWGVNDELDNGVVADTKSTVTVDYLKHTVGFGQKLTFIEAGAWGTMADAIKKDFPDQDFDLIFFYSHLPDYIFGWANSLGFLESELEVINDTFEALPKGILRPTKLIVNGSGIAVDLLGMQVNSTLVKAWAPAVMTGFHDAAVDYLAGKIIDPKEAINQVLLLSEKARNAGKFTGVLPYHTQTWSEGQKWKENWPWGRIPPLK